MAEMELGYGSEYQLMRFLGHHREELNKLIQNETGQHEDIRWLDYPYNNGRISGDGELKGIECFNHLENYAEIKAAWENYWPQTGTPMNWDGVFSIDDTWYFVEAKAHREECRQKCGASSEKSKATINKAFTQTIDWLKTNGCLKSTISPTQWIDSNCYQLANRLAFLCFCQQCGIKARLLYIGFVNGFRISRGKDEVQESDKWEEIYNEEFEELGLDAQRMNQYISFIYPVCEK